MTSDRQTALLADFIASQLFAVVATTWKGLPQAAVVAFSHTDRIELIFGTFDTTRKYRNLRANPQVAVVIGWDEAITVQYEGVASELMGRDKDSCQKIHLNKHPGSARYANSSHQSYFKLSPYWIRYTDISQEPEFSFELTFK